MTYFSLSSNDDPFQLFSHGPTALRQQGRARWHVRERSRGGGIQTPSCKPRTSLGDSHYKYENFLRNLKHIDGDTAHLRNSLEKCWARKKSSLHDVPSVRSKTGDKGSGLAAASRGARPNQNIITWLPLMLQPPYWQTQCARRLISIPSGVIVDDSSSDNPDWRTLERRVGHMSANRDDFGTTGSTCGSYSCGKLINWKTIQHSLKGTSNNPKHL